MMAEDEDQETMAALAKLAEQDPAAAEDARAALEWIAGEQGRAFITQERIQGFCWYELTGTGQATALAALRARATGPRTIPWS